MVCHKKKRVQTFTMYTCKSYFLFEIYIVCGDNACVKLSTFLLDIYTHSDAVDGFGITECGSLACLANPCRNGAVCVELKTTESAAAAEADAVVDNASEEERIGSGKPEQQQKQQHQDRWRCRCPTGFMGDLCEVSVCDNNPCQYGATCVPFPGSGYLCLCPFGKHGHYCEHSEYIQLGRIIVISCSYVFFFFY